MSQKQHTTINLCNTDVPQGSVPGPLLFFLFATPLGEVISACSVKFHQRDDDTQIYLGVDKVNSLQASVDLAAFTGSIYNWLLYNSLARNPHKSEACIFGVSCRVQLRKITIQVMVAGASITLSEHIKSLVVIIDTSQTFDQHTRDQHTSSRPCTYTYEVFDKNKGLWISRPQIQWPVPSSASGLGNCKALHVGMLACLDRIWTNCNASRTALLRWRQVYNVEITSNKFLQNCTGFPFWQGSASRSQHSSTK